MTTAGSSLEIEGRAIASSYRPPGGPSSLNVTSIPIKVTAGGESVNLDPSYTAVKYLSNQITYDDIYNGTLNFAGTFYNLEIATNQAATSDVFLGQSPYLGGNDADSND
jgi:archaellin